MFGAPAGGCDTRLAARTESGMRPDPARAVSSVLCYF